MSGALKPNQNTYLPRVGPLLGQHWFIRSVGGYKQVTSPTFSDNNDAPANEMKYVNNSIVILKRILNTLS